MFIPKQSEEKHCSVRGQLNAWSPITATFYEALCVEREYLSQALKRVDVCSSALNTNPVLMFKLARLTI